MTNKMKANQKVKQIKKTKKEISIHQHFEEQNET